MVCAAAHCVVNISRVSTLLTCKILRRLSPEIPMRDSTAGRALVKTLAKTVRSLDPAGRPVTSAVPMVGDKDEPYLEALDVGGYNYSPNRYEVDHGNFPNRVMVGTESFPKSSYEMWSHYTSNSWVIGDFIWTAIGTFFTTEYV